MWRFVGKAEDRSYRIKRDVLIVISLSLVLDVRVCNVPLCSESYLIIQLLTLFPKQILELRSSCSLFWLDNQLIQAYMEQYSIILEWIWKWWNFHLLRNPLSKTQGVHFQTFLHRSPAVAGAVVAMDRHYFQNTGAYDSDMTMWGAENLELSIRVRTLIKTSSCDNYCNFKEPEWKGKKIFVKKSAEHVGLWRLQLSL